MPIKKRILKAETIADPSLHSYHEFRGRMWDFIDRTGFDAHGSTYNGGPIPEGEMFLVPKPQLNYRDTWHCGSQEKARYLMERISLFPDIYWMEREYKWVRVKWDHHMKDHILEGQKVDDRVNYRAR